MKLLKAIGIILILTTGIAVPAQNCYQLIWADEFNTPGQPDPSGWSFDLGNQNGWGNNELQTYTDSPENSFVRDGMLVIRAIKEDGNWTSARLVTKNKADFLYGRFEIRARIPAGLGTWPAIWMLPTSQEYGNWPGSGEIDIMEHVGYDPGVVHATIHTQAYNHVIGTQVGNETRIPDFSKSFHIYSVEWTPDSITAFADGMKYFSFANDHSQQSGTWPFDKAFHLILNVAVGGNWGGAKGVDPAMTSAVMEVDYVRVFSKTKKPDISGPQKVGRGEKAAFSVPDNPQAQYQWIIPDDIRILGSATSPAIVLAMGKNDARLRCRILLPCGEISTPEFTVSVE